MITTRHIIDNEQASVADHLRRHLSGADAFDFVSAYFSIYGYELLMNELDGIGEVRFLFGDPASVEDLDPGSKDPKSFTVTEKGLTPNHTCYRNTWRSGAPIGLVGTPLPSAQ